MERIAQFEKVTLDQYQSNCNHENIEQIYNDIQLPKRATTGSAGYDFYAPYDFCLKPGETILIPTGIRCKINDGWFLAIFPRSGLGFKYRAQLDNTVGIIDSDYYYSDNQGHIMVKLTNDSKNDRVLEVKNGQGFAQGIFMSYGITNDDDASEVRNGGFGSTTK